MFTKINLWPLAGSVALAAFMAGAASAAAADITVSDARITAGKLVIEGGTGIPNARVRLDGRGARAFNVTSDARGKFRFELAYLPTDCIVTLQELNGRPATEAVVADCGRGLSPRGEWSKRADYHENDLVTHDGSTWLARRDNAGEPPANGLDWQLFAHGAAGLEESEESASSGGAAGSARLAGASGAARRAPPTGAAGGDLTGTYPNPQIRKGAVTTRKLKDGSVTSAKIADGTVTGGDIAARTLTSADLAFSAVASFEVLDNSLTADDLAGSSVGSSEIQTGAVGASEIPDNAIDSGEIVDFSLTNQDIGVLFAEVNGIGGVDNSSGGVTAAQLGNGIYQVDFGRDISFCAAVATIGFSFSSSAVGQVSVSDSSSNAEAVTVLTHNSTGTIANLPFRLVVVC